MERQRSHLAHALAGTGAGSIACLATYPLDLVKTRFQVSKHPGYSGTVDALQQIVRREGVGALYKGIGTSLFGSAFAWGVYFYGYNTFKSLLSDRGARTLGAPDHLAAGCAAGSLVAAATNPIWVVKTRLQTDLSLQTGQRAYRGLIDGLVTIGRREGLRGLYKGIGPSLLAVSQGAVQFTVYEDLKRRLRILRDGDDLGVLEFGAASAVSKVAGVTATYPFSTVRAIVQDHRGSVSATASLFRLVREHGALALYRGFAPNLLRMLPSSVITFVSYEQLLRVIDRLDATAD